MNIRKLKIIGKQLTGLKIKNDKKDITCLITDYGKRSYKEYNQYINLNFKHIDEVFSDQRFYISKKEKSNRYLIALLHEVAHKRQYSKMSTKTWIKGSYNNDITEAREDVANRYARRYFNRFIKTRI